MVGLRLALLEQMCEGRLGWRRNTDCTLHSGSQKYHNLSVKNQLGFCGTKINLFQKSPLSVP
jgi:hypothetical protein